MSWTSFGLIYAPIFLLIIFFARSWTPILLVLSTVFQAASIINIQVGSTIFGVTPYTATAACCTFLLTTQTLLNKPHFELPIHLPRAALFFLIYVVIACFSGILLPFVFEGQLVHSPMNKYAIGQPPTELSFQLTNIVQVTNLLMHLACGCFFWQSSRQSSWRKSFILFGLLASLFIAILANLYERISLFGLVPSSAAFWSSNLGYEQANVVGDNVWARIGLPFTEPSYASALFAAGTVGGFAIALFGRRFVTGFAVSIVSGSALLNSMGSTGWAAATFGIFGLMVWRFASKKYNETLHGRDLAMLFGILTIAAGFFWVWKVSPFASQVSVLLHQLIVGKLSLSTSMARHETNMHSFALLFQTWGLGVGLGSNRPSSFLASLLSNTGLAGGAAFFAMLGTLLWNYRKVHLLSDAQLFASASLVTMTIAMVIGIPDLNLPLYWAFVLLAFVYCPSVQCISKSSERNLPNTSH